METNRRNLLAAAALGGSFAMLPSVRLAAEETQKAPLRLNANENQYGPSTSALAALTDAGFESWKYGVEEFFALRKAIADQHGIKPENIITTAGSGELLGVAGIAFTGPFRPLVAGTPSFARIQNYARAHGAEVIEVSLNAEHAHDLDTMAAYVTPETGCVYVCNPNNPTGTMLSGDRIREFALSIPEGPTLIVDEAYIELMPEPEAASLWKMAVSKPGVLVTRTFSKLHGLAGLRVGYGIAHEGTIKQLAALKATFANTISFRAALASYEDEAFKAFSLAKITEAREMTERFLKGQGLEYIPSYTNFVLFNPGPMGGKAFQTAMKERGVLVMTGYPEYEQWVRVSMGRVEDMPRFFEAADTVLKSA